MWAWTMTRCRTECCKSPSRFKYGFESRWDHQLDVIEEHADVPRTWSSRHFGNSPACVSKVPRKTTPLASVGPGESSCRFAWYRCMHARAARASAPSHVAAPALPLPHHGVDHGASASGSCQRPYSLHSRQMFSRSSGRDVCRRFGGPIRTRATASPASSFRPTGRHSGWV